MDGGTWWAAVHGVIKESDTTEQLHSHFSLSCTGEGNGNPLQYSCLENPRDEGAWWAAGGAWWVAQSRTQLRQLSSSSSSSMILFIFIGIQLLYQGCVSLCSTATWISRMFTCISFLDFLPIEVTTEHGIEFPVPCSRFSLVIYFIHSISSVYTSEDKWSHIFISYALYYVD